MKRSEAIDIIKERLYNLPQDKAYLWKYIDEEADSILSELEEAGMTPPRYYSTVEGHKCDIKVYSDSWEEE